MNLPIVDDVELTPYVPAGHPVRSFALLLVVAAALAVALWWSALAAPRLDAGGGSGGSLNHETLEGEVLVSVRNAGPLPLRLEQVTVGGSGYRSTGVAMLVPDPDPETLGGRDLPAFEPTDLAAGESAELQIGFAAVDCLTEDPTVKVHVRTAAGVRRTVELGRRDQMEMFCADRPPG